MIEAFKYTYSCVALGKGCEVVDDDYVESIYREFIRSSVTIIYSDVAKA